MNEVLQFLQDNPTFYIATVDGDEAKVRPFGFVMELDGKLYFGTNNKKGVYQQLLANPNFEISTTGANNQWLRLKGKAVMDSRPEVCKKAFEAAPFFHQLYQTPDNPILAFFYIADAEANFYTITGETRTVTF